jgi:hypothetical protein
MEKLLRTALIASCLVIVAEKARADFEVTHTPGPFGGWTSTYRELSSNDAGGSSVVQLPRHFKAEPNACDRSGRGPAFEVVTRQPGEAECIGRR